MKCNYVQAKLDYLDLLFNYFKSLNLDEELKSHISKYLTVLISGIYEDSIKNILKESIHRESITKEVKGFIFKQIDTIFRNPTHKNLKGLLNRFNKAWLNKIHQKIVDEEWEALNSIVNNKNNIAHGDSSSITFDDIFTYYQKSKKILTELDSLII